MLASVVTIPSLMSTDLPPEAYTKDTLQAAFDWLQSQPEVVRNTVHTPDRLVSLFRKSQRMNDHSGSVGSKQFLSDLKKLSTSLDQFESPLSPPNPETIVSAPEPPAPVAVMSAPTPVVTPMSPMETSAMQPLPQEPIPQHIGTEQKTTETTQKASFELTTQTRETVSTQLEMDELTLERVELVRKRFNLSSTKEALRLLVSIGYEKFSNFP